jgi:hypothetical protein
MPQVDIDEGELLRLRRIEGTVGAIVKNPVAKKALAKALKEVNPDDPLAKEADRVDPMEARFNALEEQNAALKKQVEDGETTRQKDARLAQLKDDQDRGFQSLKTSNWTDEGIKKVREVMEEKGILDVAVAAAWVEKQMPPSQNPVMPGSSGSWGFFDAPPGDGADKFVEQLLATKGESVPLVHNRAMEAIAELRGPSRR